VDIVEPEADGTFRLVGIFGDQKTIRGRLKAMKLVDHRIVFSDCD
jgi:predicted RNA-binding protein